MIVINLLDRDTHSPSYIIFACCVFPVLYEYLIQVRDDVEQLVEQPAVKRVGSWGEACKWKGGQQRSMTNIKLKY